MTAWPECIRTAHENGGQLALLGDLYLENEVLHLTNWLEPIRYAEPVSGSNVYYASAPFAISDDGIVKDTKEVSVVQIAFGLFLGRDQVNFTETQQEQFSQSFTEIEDYLDRHDLRGAFVLLRIVNPDDLSDDVVLHSGLIDEFVIEDNVLMVEVASAEDILNAPTFPVSPSCPHTFGDSWCGVDRESSANLYTGTADSGSTESQIIDSSISPATEGYWDIAIIEILSGANEGAIREVKQWDHSTTTITPLVSFENTISSGDQFRLRRQCKKTFDFCKTLNSNPERFGGCPYTTQPVQGLYWRGKT
ncbi:MAG: DUF2163 domain-containing protein [Planctomycetes bacterium]|nr:DUF2163 domain-containing protein [Planctomycetota bacterium]